MCRYHGYKEAAKGRGLSPRMSEMPEKAPTPLLAGIIGIAWSSALSLRRLDRSEPTRKQLPSERLDFTRL